MDHPFVHRPHRTMLGLAWPVLLSLIAEPLMGLVDTAFVAQLGAAPLAALGVGTILMSGAFWLCNFLNVGTQTETARALGANENTLARQNAGAALVVACGCGLVIIALGSVALEPLVEWMGAQGEVRDAALAYLRVRLWAAPAVLVTMASFGALRGALDMRTPLAVAVTINVVNVALDALLIPGWGELPPLGVAGAAWATMISQWLGVGLSLAAVARRFGWARKLHLEHARRLLRSAPDLMARTLLLGGFLVLCTREATRMGPEAGAAHQAVRQTWFFTALLLDAFAASAQSLVGFFLGANERPLARKVARYASGWSVLTGFVLCLTMLSATRPVRELLVPASAYALFWQAWWVAAASQPINALCFATDGILWGRGDYAYLRNGVVLATTLGTAGVWLIDESSANALLYLWLVNAGWVGVRGSWGVVGTLRRL